MSRRVRVRERVPVETGAVGTDWFLFFLYERIKLVSTHLFLFLGFYGFGLGLGFGLLRIEKSRPLPFVSLSLSFERAKVRGSFSTPSNECKRVHTTTDRPTDAGKRRERCSVRARENDTKNPLQDHARKPPVVGTRKNRDKRANKSTRILP